MSLEIKNLSKQYANGVKALNNLSLTIPTGMFGLLGPNGAGKSSLMRSIATLQSPDTGSIQWGEIDVLNQPEEFRKVLGYLPQEFGVYQRATAQDLLDHMAILKGIADKKERKKTVKTLLHRVNLYEVRKKAVAGFSGGMRQRFGIAQALLGNPQVVIVDEPTAGLDPGERNRFYNLLSEIGENVAVILSTHIVQDVQQLCQNMAIINRGELLYEGKPGSALASMEGKIWEKQIEKDQVNEYSKRHSVISSRLAMGKPIIHVHSELDPGEGFRPVEADLEDVFFSTIFLADHVEVTH
ncbi:MAG: ABC transporter ATP-binding protein [Flavobacteriales bacterium]|nr:ABC transporter ATP-binding protein [Flavobacteriales bacterium]